MAEWWIHNLWIHNLYEFGLWLTKCRWIDENSCILAEIPVHRRGVSQNQATKCSFPGRIKVNSVQFIQRHDNISIHRENMWSNSSEMPSSQPESRWIQGQLPVFSFTGEKMNCTGGGASSPYKQAQNPLSFLLKRSTDLSPTYNRSCPNLSPFLLAFTHRPYIVITSAIHQPYAIHPPAIHRLYIGYTSAPR